MKKVTGWASAIVLMWGVSAVAADIPGGLLRTAEKMRSDTYELVISPSVQVSQGGAYLTSELRYQPFDMLGVGASFGAGELGFNLGMNSVWHLFPTRNLEPEFAVLSGFYLNRVAEANYFAVKVAPMVSQTFFMTWGQITPYGGAHFTPSFRLGEPANLFSIKGTLGTQFALQSGNGLRVMLEAGIGLLNSGHEVSLGISYPFAAM